MDDRLERRDTLHIPAGFVCQNDCVFCCDGGFGRHEAPLPDAVVREVLAANTARDTVEFTGHEPTLNPALPRWTAMARELGFRTVSIVTNGRTLARRGLLERLLSAGVNRVQISLHAADAALHDAITRRRGSFEQAVAGIEAVVAARRRGRGRPVLHVQSTLTGMNVGQLQPLLAFVRRLAPDLHGLNCVFLVNRAAANIEQTAVPYAEIVAAVAAARPWSLGQRVVLSEIPHCQTIGRLPAELVGLREEFHLPELDLERWRVVDPTASARGRGFGYGPPCEGCALRARCDGVVESYIDRYGWEGFEPVSPAQLDALHYGDPDELRRLFRDPRGRWEVVGLERTFDSATVSLRARHLDAQVAMTLRDRDDAQPAFGRGRRFDLDLEGQGHSPAQLRLAKAVAAALRRA